MENARVLLVEDDESWLELVEMIMARTTHRVTRLCADQAAAMEALDAATQEPDQQGFDVVLLDGNFPPSKTINGEAAQRVISELRATHWCAGDCFF